MQRARFKEIGIAAALFALAGCALWAPWKPGDDPRGRALKARADTVVTALERYRADNGRLPSHLFELLPKYLPQLPDGVKTEYDPGRDSLAFAYEPPRPDHGVTTCTIEIGRGGWSCSGFL